MTVLETLKAQRVGTNGYSLEFFTKPDGGNVTKVFDIDSNGNITQTGTTASLANGVLVANAVDVNIAKPLTVSSGGTTILSGDLTTILLNRNTVVVGTLKAWENTDSTHILGRGSLGYITGAGSNSFYISNSSFHNLTNYLLLQDTNGSGYLNAKAGQSVFIRNNNTTIATFSGSAITMNQPLTLAGLFTTGNAQSIRNNSYDSLDISGETSIGFGYLDHIGARISAYKESANTTGFKIYGELGYNTPSLLATFGNSSIQMDKPLKVKATSFVVERTANTQRATIDVEAGKFKLSSINPESATYQSFEFISGNNTATQVLATFSSSAITMNQPVTASAGINTDNVTYKVKKFTGTLDSNGDAIVTHGIDYNKILAVSCFYFQDATGKWTLLKGSSGQVIEVSSTQIDCTGGLGLVGKSFRMIATYEV